MGITEEQRLTALELLNKMAYARNEEQLLALKQQLEDLDTEKVCLEQMLTRIYFMLQYDTSGLKNVGGVVFSQDKFSVL